MLTFYNTVLYVVNTTHTATLDKAPLLCSQLNHG